MYLRWCVFVFFCFFSVLFSQRFYCLQTHMSGRCYHEIPMNKTCTVIGKPYLGGVFKGSNTSCSEPKFAWKFFKLTEQIQIRPLVHHICMSYVGQ